MKKDLPRRSKHLLKILFSFSEHRYNIGSPIFDDWSQVTEYQFQNYRTAVYNGNTSLIPLRPNLSHIDLPSVSNDTIEQTVVTSSSGYLTHHRNHTSSFPKMASHIPDEEILENEYGHRKGHSKTSNTDA